MPGDGPRYEQIDHTADVGLLVRGETLSLLFENAALGLFDVISGLDSIEPREERLVTVEAPGREELLVRWLSELNFIFSTEGMLFCAFHVASITDERLEARISGEPYDPERHSLEVEVKAVTFHRLRVDNLPSGWEAVVVFDI